MQKKPGKALGRGLSSLLPSKSAPVAPAPPPQPEIKIESAGFLKVSIDLVDPNESQPRTEFRPEQLQELSDSIRVNGVIQPLIVRKKGSRYELIAGERRWRASRMAELSEVPVVIQEIADDQVLQVALIENIQREDLNAIETAIAFDRLAREFNLSHDEVGKRTGKDRSTVTNMVRLLRLPKEVQLMVANHQLSMGHARAILGLPSEEMQRSVAEQVVSQGLSVRAVEHLIRKLMEPIPEKEEKQPVRIDPNVQAAIEELERALGTRVRVIEKNKDRGKIEIEYFSQDDLDRIYQQIVGEQ